MKQVVTLLKTIFNISISFENIYFPKRGSISKKVEISLSLSLSRENQQLQKHCITHHRDRIIDFLYPNLITYSSDCCKEGVMAL